MSSKPLDGQISLMMRTGMQDEQFRYLMECATIYADKIRETNMAPIQAMLMALLTFTLSGASCKATRDDLQTIINDNMDDLLRVAEEFVSTCPHVGEDVLSSHWNQRVHVPDGEIIQ